MIAPQSLAHDCGREEKQAIYFPPEVILMPRNATPFIRKTYELLSDKDLVDIIQWSPLGDSFMIVQPSIFESNILPKFFKHSNLNSFVRQLNTYGFKKMVKKDSKDLEFKHKLFLKGQESLLPFITRRGNTSKQQTKKEEEVYSNIKRSVEEQEYIKKIISENESLTKELRDARSKQLQAEAEIFNLRKELLEAKIMLRRVNCVPQIPFHCYSPQQNFSNMIHTSPVDTSFLDSLLKSNPKNSCNDAIFNEGIFNELEDVMPLPLHQSVDIPSSFIDSQH